MNFRQLMVKTKQRFIVRERFVFKPISRVVQTLGNPLHDLLRIATDVPLRLTIDRKSTRLNSSHVSISYAVFCLKKKKKKKNKTLINKKKKTSTIKLIIN